MIVISKATFEKYQFCLSGVLVQEVVKVDSRSHKTVITFDNEEVAVRVITGDGVSYLKC